MLPSLEQLWESYDDVSRIVQNSPSAVSATRSYLLACRAFQVRPDSGVQLCCEATDILNLRRVSLYEVSEGLRKKYADEQARRALGADYWDSYVKSQRDALVTEERAHRERQTAEVEVAAAQSDYLLLNDKNAAAIKVAHQILSEERCRLLASQEALLVGDAVAAEAVTQRQIEKLEVEAAKIERRLESLMNKVGPDAGDAEHGDVGDAVSCQTATDPTVLCRRDSYLVVIAEEDSRCFIEMEESMDWERGIVSPFYRSMDLIASILSTSGSVVGILDPVWSKELMNLSQGNYLPCRRSAPSRDIVGNHSKFQRQQKEVQPLKFGTFPLSCYLSGVYNLLAAVICLPSCTRMRVLDLSHSRITSPVAILISQVLLTGGSMPNLRTLVLDGNPIGSVALERIAAAIQTHPSLRKISLKDGPQGMSSTTRKIEQFCASRASFGQAVDALEVLINDCESEQEFSCRMDVELEETRARRGLQRAFASVRDGELTLGFNVDGTIMLSALSLALLNEKPSSAVGQQRRPSTSNSAAPHTIADITPERKASASQPSVRSSSSSVSRGSVDKVSKRRKNSSKGDDKEPKKSKKSKK